MKYEFPYIEHIDDISAAIQDRDEFIIARREELGFTVINYLVNFADTFPTPDTKDPELNRLYAIRRDCRGLKFDLEGNIIARPYHKFFNLNERPETMQDKIDFSKEFIILDKLDGSMIHPLFLKGKMQFVVNDFEKIDLNIHFIKELHMSTKMGLTDVAAAAFQYVSDTPDMYYEKFCHDLNAAGMMPIFEWCSRKNRIIIDYPEDKLVLTAVRDIKTGEYLVYDDMVDVARPYKFPIVKAWPGDFDGIALFVEEIKGREDEEGYVIRFADGHMLKMKNEWYCHLHKVKELLNFEKDVLSLILHDRQDDAKSAMLDEDKDKIDSFAEDLHRELNKTADRLNWIVIEAKDNLNESRKRFALEAIPSMVANEKGLLFSIWEGQDPLTVVKDYVMSQLGSSTKVDGIRDLIGGIHWSRY